ncbi:hypothetical protein JCM6882_006954 [Rhodosporidiobolus microsporus]
MHRFWQPANVLLHSMLFSHLTHGTTIHALIPLLGVNKHLRRQVERKLVAVFRNTRAYRTGNRAGTVDGEGFLRIEEGEWGHSDFGPVSARNDPRWLFSNQPRPWDDPSLLLLLSHYDPATTICTFKPANPNDTSLQFGRDVDSRTGVPLSHCDGSSPVFIGGSSMWFKPGLPQHGRKRFAGLVLATKPWRHASRTPLMIPEVSEYRGGAVKDARYRCANGWEANITTKRLKLRRQFQDGDEIVQVKLIVELIKVPLVQLFIPPTTSKDDIDEYYREENQGMTEHQLVDQFEAEFFDL